MILNVKIGTQNWYTKNMKFEWDLVSKISSHIGYKIHL